MYQPIHIAFSKSNFIFFSVNLYFASKWNKELKNYQGTFVIDHFLTMKDSPGEVYKAESGARSASERLQGRYARYRYISLKWITNTEVGKIFK